MKVLIYNDDGSILSGDMDPKSYVSKHLQLYEVANVSAVEDIKYVQTKETRDALKCWEFVREKWARGIKLNSNYRTRSYNAKVGGVSNSLHLGALGFDNAIGNVNNATFNNWVQWATDAANKYGMCAEVLRYSWGIHTGYCYKLPYTNKKIYVLDKR